MDVLWTYSTPVCSSEPLSDIWSCGDERQRQMEEAQGRAEGHKERQREQKNQL